MLGDRFHLGRFRCFDHYLSYLPGVLDQYRFIVLQRLDVQQHRQYLGEYTEMKTFLCESNI